MAGWSADRGSSDLARIPCYTDLVANLTITVDEETLRRARIRALQQGTSVTAILADRIRGYAGEDERQQAATRRLLDLSRSAKRAKRSLVRSRRPTRDELHER